MLNRREDEETGVVKEIYEREKEQCSFVPKRSKGSAKLHDFLHMN